MTDEPSSSLDSFEKASGSDESPRPEQHPQQEQQSPESDRNAQRRAGNDEGEEEEEDEPVITLEPAKRWLPILSGLLCPFSVLLEIPGLTERWYVRTYGYNIVETRENPPILDAGLAISMALGVFANIGLIFRFLEKRVLLSTWVSIISLSLHDIINIVALITFGVIHRFNDGFTYGQAYWQTTAATVASLACNITIILDYVRTKDFRRQGSGLTEKQRSLVISVMVLMGWIALGSLCFIYLFDPNLTYIDAMYFVMVTVSSVGFGDVVPTNVQGRLFSFIYDPVGIIMLAWCIAVARETIIESFEASYRYRREKLARKARERKEHRRRKMQMKRERRERDVEDLAEKSGLSLREFHTRMSNVGSGGDLVPNDGSKQSNLLSRARQTQLEIDYMCERQQGVGLVRANLRFYLRKFGFKKPLAPQDRHQLKMHRTMTDASTMSEDGFMSFRQQLLDEQTREFRVKITLATSLFLLFWLVGAAIFSATESWTYFEGLWFCFIFFTTIGYGDFIVKSSGGRSFFLAWALFGIGTMTILISVLTETWSSRYKSSIVESKVKRTIRKVAAKKQSTISHASTRPSSPKPETQVKPSEIPAKLLQAAKDFDHHARYFMAGRTGEPPERLRVMSNAVVDFEEEIAKIHEAGDLELGKHADIKHFMFMMSYQTSLDNLIEAAESMTEVAKAHTEELATMRALNGHLRCAIHESKRFVDGVEQDSSDKGKQREGEEEVVEEQEEETTITYSADKGRPPGGFGEDLVDLELEREIDGDDDADQAAVTRTPPRKKDRHRSNTKDKLASLSPLHLLDVSASILHRHGIGHDEAASPSVDQLRQRRPSEQSQVSSPSSPVKSPGGISFIEPRRRPS